MIKSDKKICIFGTGGFGREVLCCLIDSIAKTDLKIDEVACFMVNDNHYTVPNMMGVEVISHSDFDPNLYHVVVAIGDPVARKSVVESLPSTTTFTTIIHPTAVISEWVEIGEGSIITAGAILTCNIKIGKHAHVNLHASIAHDCIVGHYFTAAPGARLSGNCNLGNGVYLGTNSAVKQGIRICDNATIGMGGMVVKDIAEPGVYVGNPLGRLRK